MVLRAEPRKQKTRSCRTQELARSSARENEWQKKGGLLNWEDRCGIGRDMWAGKAEQKKSAVPRSPQLPQWRSIQVAPAFCGHYFRVADNPPGISLFASQTFCRDSKRGR